MKPEELKKIAAAYNLEMERLFVEAEKRGFVDPDFTAEKRAAYRDLEKTAGEAGLEILDTLAFHMLEPVQKVALAGGMGALMCKESGWFDSLMRGAGRMAAPLVRAGGAAAGAAAGAVEQAGAGAAAKAVAPSQGFLQAYAKRGLGADVAKANLSRFSEMGPVAYTRMRRAIGRPAMGAMGGGAAAAGAAAGTAAKRPAWSEAMKELRSGALFGGGFGMLSRLTAPAEEQTKVQVG